MSRLRTFPVLVLVAACAGLGTADADAGLPFLLGNYAATGSAACISSPTGFTEELTPVDPSLAYGVSAALSGSFLFNEPGKGKLTLSEVYVVPPPVPAGVTVVGAAQVTLAGSFTYSISGNEISAEARNVTITGGIIDKISTTGLISRDRKSMTLATATPEILTTVFTGGEILPQACWLSFALFQ